MERGIVKSARAGQGVVRPGVKTFRMKVAGSSGHYQLNTVHGIIPQLKSPEAQQNVLVRVSPSRYLAPTDFENNLTRQMFVRLEDITLPQMANAVYLWRLENPGATLQDNPVLLEKAQAVLAQEKETPTLTGKITAPFLDSLTRKNSVPPKSFQEWLDATATYPHTVELDEAGFPKKFVSATARLDKQLLAADPVSMGIYAVEIYQILNETEMAACAGLALTEPERVAAEELIQKRLERTAIPITSSPREVLQVAYDYFGTKQLLSGQSTLRYMYRTDEPFEELTSAEKDAFMVHKLVRYQIEHASPWNPDVAHLRVLDYVAAREIHYGHNGPALIEEMHYVINSWRVLTSSLGNQELSPAAKKLKYELAETLVDDYNWVKSYDFAYSDPLWEERLAHLRREISNVTHFEIIGGYMLYW